MRQTSATPLDKLKAFIFYALPHHFISGIVFKLTRIKSPKALPVIRWFIKIFKVEMGDALNPDPSSYASFNDFFIRALADGARPLCGGDYLASPVDGTVSQACAINDGSMFQAKDHTYTANELLGNEPNLRDTFKNGQFTTIYLAPYNYHRIHMPCDGTLTQMIHVPGRLFSVAPWTVNSVPGLFARNERVVCIFDTQHGPLAMVLVGAINVAAIETVWGSLITPPKAKKISAQRYEKRKITLKKGAEMGRFNMGSTVILLTNADITWLDKMQNGQTLKMGEAIAKH